MDDYPNAQTAEVIRGESTSEESMDQSKDQTIANQSFVSEFLLLEFSKVREFQIIHFVIFLVLYLAIVTGNLLIISAVAFDHRLHTPMYLFLMNLAMQDLGQVSVIIPKSMANSLMNSRHISYSGCVAQVLFFTFFISTDFFLLIVMAYDRYAAICNPLQYQMVMNLRACTEMILTVWITGFLYAGLHTVSTFATPFCSNVVNQFFCEIPQLIKLSCSKKNQIETGIVLLFALVGLGCFIFVLVTYVQIFSAVLRMPSAQGRQKAFSTCLPHLMVFSTFMVTGLFSYLSPMTNTATHLDLFFTVIYSMVPPLLNPLIYSMRNKEIKAALSNMLRLKTSSNKFVFSFLI
ncbi:olfactory receptor 14I1-like [Podarcis raffonei]|uniref:olfactory receptor 14I1-like n=1 Tax=Podarcis raffonei TaxID=65483 RepID=UPI0023296DFA|nr:olfactory receptor 14I1-like [Podarcis raffonei]